MTPINNLQSEFERVAKNYGLCLTKNQDGIYVAHKTDAAWLWFRVGYSYAD